MPFAQSCWPLLEKSPPIVYSKAKPQLKGQQSFSCNKWNLENHKTNKTVAERSPLTHVEWLNNRRETDKWLQSFESENQWPLLHRSVFLRTCVLPLPVCPYAKQVAIPRSNIHSTSGLAVYLEKGATITLNYKVIMTEVGKNEQLNTDN